MMKIGIAGCAGRMGRALLRETLRDRRLTLAAGSVAPGAAEAGQDLGALAGQVPIGVAAVTETEPLVAASDVVIDFTTPDLTAMLARTCEAMGKSLVTGTTGLNSEQQAAVEQAAQFVPIVQAGNMSAGVNLLLGLVEKAAATLGEEFDIEIVEMHHRHKADAPSGTALMLGAAAAAGREVALADAACFVREGQVGPRPAGQIGFAVLRGGDVVGDHTAIFAGEGERIELGHKASDRSVFASGAIRAALWLRQQPPGLYHMRDVLDI